MARQGAITAANTRSSAGSLNSASRTGLGLPEAAGGRAMRSGRPAAAFQARASAASSRNDRLKRSDVVHQPETLRGGAARPSRATVYSLWVSPQASGPS